MLFCYNRGMGELSIRISIERQVLYLEKYGSILRSFPVSTASAGTGTEPMSYKTPLGNFRVAEKVGEGCPEGTIFRSRTPAGIWSKEDLGEQEDDLITSRILWLDGLDEENRNTKDRFIYIHGTNHEEEIGSPASCGCIRMLNADIIEIFDAVEEGTHVIIE